MIFSSRSLLAECTRRYLEHLRLAGSSEATLRSQTNALAQFAKTLSAQDLREVTLDELQGYAGRLAQSVSRETAHLYLRAVKRFFRFLAESDLLLLDPSLGLALPKLRRKLVGPVLGEEQIQRLLASADVSTPLGVRDRALLEFLYSTGLRAREARSVKVEDLDLQNGLAHVREGKGAKDRVVPLGRAAVDWLRRYIAALSPKEALFVSQSGKPLGEVVFGQHLRKLGRKADLGVNLTCHLLRRTLATRMLQNGASPAQVAAILGHEDLRSLGRYVAFASRQIKEAHSASHPRERDDR